MDSFEKLKITNVEREQLNSDIILCFEEIVRSKFPNINIEVEKEKIPGAKGEIIIGIIIGLATNAIYDILKYAVLSLKERRDFNSKNKININGDDITLQDILDKKIDD